MLTWNQTLHLPLDLTEGYRHDVSCFCEAYLFLSQGNELVNSTNNNILYSSEMLLSSLFKQPNEGRFTIATSGRNHWRYKRIPNSISWVILHNAVISCTFKMNFTEGYPQSELTLNSNNQVITSFQQKFIYMTFVPASSFFPSHSALVFNTSLKNEGSEFPASLTGWAQSDWHWLILCHIHIHYQRIWRPAVQHKTQRAKLLFSLGRQIYLFKERKKERHLQSVLRLGNTMSSCSAD